MRKSKVFRMLPVNREDDVAAPAVTAMPSTDDISLSEYPPANK